MKDDIISILSCNQFLTEKEIQRFLPSFSSKKEIQEVLLQSAIQIKLVLLILPTVS